MYECVPARHDSVEAHPEFAEGLQYAARHCRLKQQSHAGCEGFGIRDQVTRWKKSQLLQDPHQPGTAGWQLLEGWEVGAGDTLAVKSCYDYHKYLLHTINTFLNWATVRKRYTTALSFPPILDNKCLHVAYSLLSKIYFSVLNNNRVIQRGKVSNTGHLNSLDTTRSDISLLNLLL